MALPDLLWTCPDCGPPHRLVQIEAGAECGGCGARFCRTRGAAIARTTTDGRSLVRSASEWVDMLPDPGILLDQAWDGQPVRRAAVLARMVSGEGVARDGKVYLNRFERLGEPHPGMLELWRDRLGFHPDQERTAETRWWPLLEITALQASSSTLQVNRRRTPLTTFRFQDDSVFLWELLLRAALRRLYHATGQGEIVEFQPRIVTAR